VFKRNRPNIFAGKPIGSGVPAGVYGISAEVAARFRDLTNVEDIDTGGIGGNRNNWQTNEFQVHSVETP
jgi:glutamate-1-semialdehyde aminotransferase